jgi:hypothetical protein
MEDRAARRRPYPRKVVGTYGDPTLDQLEEQVDSSNQTLKIAEANFRQAGAAIRFNCAAEAPTVGTSPSIAAVRPSANKPYFHSSQVNNGTGDFILPFDLSYEIDLWGRVRRTVAASKQQAQASAADLATARLSLHAEVAVDYFEVRSADAQERLLNDTVKAYAEALRLTENRFEGGFIYDPNFKWIFETSTWLRKSSSPRASRQRAQTKSRGGPIHRRLPSTRDSQQRQLFLAVIERRMTGIFQQVAGSLPQEPPVEDTLRNFGSALIRLALSKEQIALVRVISMEAAKFPELGKRFYKLGPKRGEEALAAYLRKQAEKGRLSNDDTRQMAQHFMGLVTGGPVRWFVLGFVPSSLSESALQKHLKSAIQVFMRAYGRIPAN